MSDYREMFVIVLNIFYKKQKSFCCDFWVSVFFKISKSVEVGVGVDGELTNYDFKGWRGMGSSLNGMHVF